jgi:hypothetical protein
LKATWVAVLFSALGAARVGAALFRGERSSGELVLAYLMLVLTPVVVAKEIAAQRRGAR